jgi:hypothetical protein
MYFVCVTALDKLLPRFTRKEKINKNKIIPNFTKRVVNNQPISLEIISSMFQKTPKKNAPTIASLTPLKA